MRALLTGVSLLISFSLLSQNQMRSMKPASGTVCYMGTHNANTVVPLPRHLRQKKLHGARTQTANIQVNYSGFSPEAQAAFEAAVEIWEALITSPVTIRIDANWAPLGATILGGASAGSFYTNFDGAPRNGVWYPVALAEKIAGKELNETNEPDIVATFNSNNNNWHFGLTDEDPEPGKYDLMTVVLHEIGHGLGITHSYDGESSVAEIASYFSDQPVVFETNVENGDGENIVTQFGQPSVELKAQLVSDNLFYNTPLILAANGGQRARIYAPANYSSGSSIAHLNEATYPAGTPNSMMTPQFQMQERILDPGPIAMAILKEIGWVRTRIDHEALQNTEDATGPFEVKAKIVSDDGYDQSSVKLTYTEDNGVVTEVAMTTTGGAHEFAASIPGGVNSYRYFISVQDVSDRVFTNPGVLYRQGEDAVQNEHQFSVGPDTKAPFINHTQVKFITVDDPFSVDAVVSDNFGVAEVVMDWQINAEDQPAQTLSLVPGTDSTYAVTISFAGDPLNVGDVITYRLRAKDVSITGNTRAIPSASGFFSLNVAGLETARDFYINDFNNPGSASDFFGHGFDVAVGEGFTNGAIHTLHPYPEGFDAPGEKRNLTYTLKYPIIVKPTNATIRFDEIVLIEPGENGSVFGEMDFFDYVVVEGSVDGGVTWGPIADGYDSRTNQVWLTAYNSNVVANISTAVGTPAMYRPREINLLSKYAVDDEVAIRFRLFSDAYAAGWGWAIDNLRIQIDETPPVIVHQHFDHVMVGAAEATVEAQITDLAGLESVVVEYGRAGDAMVLAPLIVNPAFNSYSFKIPLNTLSLSAGNDLLYRIRAIDNNGNTTTMPASGFYSAAVVTMSSPGTTFTHDFNTATSDISGNFFSVAQPDGFNNGAVHSIHPYTFQGPINTNFTFIVEKPIVVSATNPYVSFDEIVVAEYTFTSFKDYVVVEGSLDGIAWEPLLDPYSSNAVNMWRSLFDTGNAPAAANFVNRLINITSTGKFKAGDVILIRFRLFSDKVAASWGWAIDNLSIQGPITGVESVQDATVWPNPAHDKVQLKFYLRQPASVAVNFITPQGQICRREVFQAPAGLVDKEFGISDLPKGLLLMKVDTGEAAIVKKIVRE